MENNEILKITSLSDLQEYARGSVVRFPDFAEGKPFIARVCRPSLMVLAKSGKIPNALLNSASELFAKGSGATNSNNDRMLGDIYDICELMCEASLLEPTYKDIKNAGLNLSDEQLMAVFNYTQTGAKSLENFR